MTETYSSPLRRQAFALAADLFGKAAAADTLRDRMGGSLKDRSDTEWRVVIARLREDQSRREAPGCGFTQWQRIQHLRRQLAWTDDHLRNFIKLITQVEHERFLDAPGARAVLAGLQKIRARRSRPPASEGPARGPVPTEGQARGPVPTKGQAQGPVPTEGQAQGPAPTKGQAQGLAPTIGQQQ